MKELSTPVAWRGTALGPASGLRAFAIAFVWLVCLAALRPLSIPDEGRYVGVAWEMLRSGDWVTPTLDGMPFLHKPPLFYWLTALSLQLFGFSELAARGASILAGSVTVTVLYITLRGWAGERTARLGAAILATQPLFYAGSQFANMDLLVAACISVAVLCGAAAARRTEAAAPYRRELAAAYVAAALGVLAKGLIGLVLPAAVLAIWLALAGRWRTIGRLIWIPGLAMLAVIVMPWFIAAEARNAGFLHYFFVVQHFKRFAGTGFNNAAPVWFYLPVLFGLTLPWSAWLPVAGWRGWIERRRTAGRPVAEASLPSLMTVWLTVVLVFFSIPQSKLVGYILPALVPIAVLAALAVSIRPGPGGRSVVWRSSLAAAGTICVGAAIAFALIHPKSSRALAHAIVAAGGSRDGVAFIDDYRYDVPFYLHDGAPIFVVADWDPAEVTRHDNWRKELADAGGFAPALGRDRLIDDTGFSADLCRGRIKWVIADSERVREYPFLAVAPVAAVESDRTLWRIDAAEPRLRAGLGCDARGGRPARDPVVGLARDR